MGRCRWAAARASRAQLPERLGRHDEGVREGRAVDEVRPGLLREESRRMVVDDLHLPDEAPVRGRGEVALAGRIERVVDRGLDRRGGKGLAVVELDALAELELPGRVIDDPPALGQHRLWLEGLGVTVEQA